MSDIVKRAEELLALNEETRRAHNPSLARAEYRDSAAAYAPAFAQAVIDMAGEIARLRGIEDAAAPLFAQMQKLVAGWQRDPEMPRHPPQLGVTLDTNCGTVYAITDALQQPESRDGEET